MAARILHQYYSLEHPLPRRLISSSPQQSNSTRAFLIRQETLAHLLSSVVVTNRLLAQLSWPLIEPPVQTAPAVKAVSEDHLAVLSESVEKTATSHLLPPDLILILKQPPPLVMTTFQAREESTNPASRSHSVSVSHDLVPHLL